KLDKEGKTLTVGKQTWAAPAEGRSRWPVFIAVTKQVVEIYVGPIEERRRRGADQPVALAFLLTAGAQLENLKIAELPNSTYVPLIEARQRANATVHGPKAEVGRLQAGSLPRGLTTVDGIPFYLPDGQQQAIDVARSMSGVKDPVRNKGSFMFSTS